MIDEIIDVCGFLLALLLVGTVLCFSFMLITTPGMSGYYFMIPGLILVAIVIGAIGIKTALN